MTDKGLSWKDCVDVSTDVHNWWWGKGVGLLHMSKPLHPSVLTTTALHILFSCCKNITNALKTALDEGVKIVNFTKSRPLHSITFSALFHETGSSYTTLLLHTEVRGLSTRQSFGSSVHTTHRNSVIFVEHPFHSSLRLCETVRLQRLAYLADTFQTNSIRCFMVRHNHQHMMKSNLSHTKYIFWEHALKK
jgi:hypothetical protein